jgi:acyl-[acyl-carrier-protein]-phospholipid O-acyltransferase / long-chain-fatty-acid--[acyl-carrier-protein] ligase
LPGSSFAKTVSSPSFPNAISGDGKVGEILHGYRKITDASEGVIVPFYIDGIYGSVFSRSSRRHSSGTGWFRRTVRVIYGEPLPMQSDPKTLFDAIQSLKEKYGTQ